LDNNALEEKVDANTKNYNEDIIHLTQVLNEKKAKLNKITKKIVEKEVNIEEMQTNIVNINKCNFELSIIIVAAQWR
jgi:hypothetical protein